MTAAFLARAMVTAVAAGNGILPILIDLNRTHATNPLWQGHARLHLVQQVTTLALAAAIEVGLVWWPGVLPALRFYLACGLVATGLLGFLLAVVCRRLYGGTLHDPNGIRPVKISTPRGIVEVNVNVPIVGVATAVLAAAVWLYWRAG